MFTQDVYAFIIPYRRKAEALIEAVCEGNADDVAIALDSLRSLSRRSSIRHGDATEIVCEAVREVVQHMLWRGYAAFELGDLAFDDEETHRRARRSDLTERPFRPLQAMNRGALVRLPFGMVEILGSHRRQWDRERSLIQFYSSDRTWLVDVPRRLGGRWGLRLVLKQLRLFSGVFPKWSVTALVKEQNELRFDVPRYSQWRDAYQAAAVGRWGWPGRDTSLSHQTEFFLFYRTLTFHHALAILREHVVSEINRLLKRRLKLVAQITLRGFPSSQEILAIRDRMERGEVSLGDAYEQATRL
jgi:hypothetical protein